MTVMTETALEAAAVAYARRGWPVFPLRPRMKEPVTKHGFKDASTNLALVRAWWTMTPDANVGIATGHGFFVVDVDPRNRGDETWAALMAAHGLTETLSAETGGGGTHYFFEAPADPTYLMKAKLGEGIDLKYVGGYIVGPPSIHPDGGVYDWTAHWDSTAEFDPIIAPAPAWLLQMAERAAPVRVERGPADPNDGRPGSRYNEEGDWEALMEDSGWVLVKTEGDVMYWRRPGKAEGLSATTNHAGSDLLYVFTSSTGFEGNTAYSKFAALAVLEYGGDYGAAARALAEQYGMDAVNRGADLFTPSVTGPADGEQTGDYRFTPAFAPEHFVSQYIAYASAQTDAALEYSEACALSLLTLAGSPCRIMLGPYGEHGLPVNLYLLLVGDSTRSRKSTSQRIMKDIAEWAIPSGQLPARVTTEALIELLAKQSPSAALWTPDEFGILLAQIGRRDFLRGIEELLLTVYGGEDYTYVKAGEKTVSVRQPALTVVAASTPEALGMAGPTAQVTGLLPRFGVVFPRVLPEARQAEAIIRLKEPRNRLVVSLRQVREWTMTQKEITFTRPALDVLSAAEKSLQARGDHVVRLPAMLHKVAALSAIGDMRAAVEAKDAEAAVTVVGRWADSAGHLRPFMRLTSSDLAFEKAIESTLEIFERLSGKIGAVPRFEVAREVKTQSTRLDSIEKTLIDRRHIVVDLKTKVWMKP